MKLSKGFFYFMVANQVPYNYQPVLQVIESKHISTGARFRMYDGYFRYTHVYMPPELIARFPDVMKKSTVIKVLSYELNLNEARFFCTVSNVEIVALNVPISDTFYHIQSDYKIYTDKIMAEGITLEVDDFIPNKRQRTAEQNTSLNTTTNSTISTVKTSISSTNVNNAQSTTPTRPNITPKRRLNPAAVITDNSITPISFVSPYINKWRICGVCTSRESIRTVNGKKGPLKVFSFELADEKGDSIKITVWNELVNELDLKIRTQETYYIAGEGCIRSKNPQFNLTHHDFEISLNHNCTVEEAFDRKIPMPKFTIKRVKIADIPNIWQQNPNCVVDVLAVVDKVGEAQTIFSTKKNVEFLKKDVTLVDDSNASINFILWEENAQDLSFVEGQIVGFKGLKVSEFNGGFTVGRNMAGEFRMESNPDLLDVTNLANWYPSRDVDKILSISLSFINTSNIEEEMRTLGIVESSNMAESGDGKGVYFYCIATIIEVLKDNNIMYPACTVCNKKVILSENGGYDCTKCGIQGGASYRQKYLLTVRISDLTSEAYLTLFDDQAKELLGISAPEMEIIQRNNPEEYQNIFHGIVFKRFLFRIKVTSEYYNDKKRVRHNCVNLRQVGYPSYSKALDIVLEKLEKIV